MVQKMVNIITNKIKKDSKIKQLNIVIIRWLKLKLSHSISNNSKIIRLIREETTNIQNRKTF